MEKKLKVGVFGLWRGQSHIQAIEVLDEAEVVAICDQDPEKVEAAKKHCPHDVKVCADFDELLDSGIELVILCNYLPDHTAYAIRALKKGIPVVSECLASATMKECVDLVEAVEETGVYYSMAENTPHHEACLEMERIYQTGILGTVIYAEGEYCHPSAPSGSKYTPNNTHWRKFLPKTYYLSHSLGPLMNMTRLMPRKVIGKVAAGPGYAKRRNLQGSDSGGILLVEMEGGALFRVTGCASFGPATHWFRLACDNGGVENVRTAEDMVSLSLNPWDIPEDRGFYGRNTVYKPAPDEATKKAVSRGLVLEGHMGADFRTVRNYVHEVLEGRQPDMDVYRSVAMSAVAILGWRSVLNDSKQYDIPDFRDPAARDAYRNDDLSPWRGEIPCRITNLE